MIVYLDSSVFLRVLLNQPNKLKSFSRIERAASSKLLKTECLRTLDRSRLRGFLTESEFLTVLKEFHDGLDSIELIEISDSILDRSGESFPVDLATLDAIHLSSALKWREQTGVSPVFMTHDESLARAARFFHFEIEGC